MLYNLRKRAHSISFIRATESYILRRLLNELKLEKLDSETVHRKTFPAHGLAAERKGKQINLPFRDSPIFIWPIPVEEFLL